MTASMIVWTLDLLDWVRGQLSSRWPGAHLRGGAPDITSEPYRIRFRENGKQYWLAVSLDAIRNAGVEDVTSLLEGTNWISTIRETGGISVSVHEHTKTQPALIPWPKLGPEVKEEATA